MMKLWANYAHSTIDLAFLLTRAFRKEMLDDEKNEFGEEGYIFGSDLCCLVYLPGRGVLGCFDYISILGV